MFAASYKMANGKFVVTFLLKYANKTGSGKRFEWKKVQVKVNLKIFIKNQFERKFFQLHLVFLSEPKKIFEQIFS